MSVRGAGIPQPFGLDTASLASPRAVARNVLKRSLDVVVAAGILLVSAPFLGIVAALIALDGQPILFSHQRVGKAGKPFRCLKFRTMVPNAEERLAEILQADPDAAREWAETQKLQRDPRVTFLGRFLRAFSVDEMPQLLNVLRGEMSLVGPRPVTALELKTHYGPAAVEYVTVRPGLTGPWQVTGRSDNGFEQRVALDSAYARNPSLRKDLGILLATPAAVLSRRGAR